MQGVHKICNPFFTIFLYLIEDVRRTKILLEWVPWGYKRSGVSPPTRWTDDLRRVVDNWIQAAQNNNAKSWESPTFSSWHLAKKIMIMTDDDWNILLFNGCLIVRQSRIYISNIRCFWGLQYQMSLQDTGCSRAKPF